MNMNTPSSSINSQESFFKEELIPQKFQIKKNPHGVRLINGSDTFMDKDGRKIETTNATVHSFGDKIVIKTYEKIYTNTDGSDRFEDIMPSSWKGENGINFNTTAFKKDGDIIFSTYVIDESSRKTTYEFIINGKEYTSPTE